MEKNNKDFRKPCELYAGSDFLGRKEDYEELVKDLNTNPMPEKLKQQIAMDGRPPKVDNVKPCLKSPTTLLMVAWLKGGRWVCEEHYKELTKYYGG